MYTEQSPMDAGPRGTRATNVVKEHVYTYDIPSLDQSIGQGVMFVVWPYLPLAGCGGYGQSSRPRLSLAQ